MTSRRQYFVTGTDTGVGKTFVTSLLLRAIAAHGHTTLGLKPVASGCDLTADGLRNEDALALMAASTVKLPYAQVNPFAFAAPLAPHIAAAQEGKRLRVQQVAGLVRGALTQARANVALVEGAGGWRVPLNDTETLADVARDLELPVILVVGVRLGCINHALLTAEAIMRDGLRVAGWVANTIDPAVAVRDEQVATLRGRLAAPLLGVIDHGATADTAVLDVTPLLSAPAA